MTTTRLSRRQRRMLRYVYEAEARSGWSVSASHYDLVRALGGNKGNLSSSLRNLEAKGLIHVYRTGGGKAEAVWLTPAGKKQASYFQEVLNKEKRS
jgi:DNA-binding MarR family transcriptional regulator